MVAALLRLVARVGCCVIQIVARIYDLCAIPASGHEADAVAKDPVVAEVFVLGICWLKKHERRQDEGCQQRMLAAQHASHCKNPIWST